MRRDTLPSAARAATLHVLKSLFLLPLTCFAGVVRGCFDALVRVNVAFVGAVLRHPAVADALSSVLVKGMNAFLMQPNLNDILQIAADTMAKNQEEAARNAGQEFPKLVRIFIQGMMTPRQQHHHQQQQRDGAPSAVMDSSASTTTTRSQSSSSSSSSVSSEECSMGESPQQQHIFDAFLASEGRRRDAFESDDDDDHPARTSTSTHPQLKRGFSLKRAMTWGGGLAKQQHAE